MSYLVDTSAWIEALRKNGDPHITEQVRSAFLEGNVYCNEMILLELWNGARGEREKIYISELEDDILKCDINQETWRLAQAIATKARQNGLTLPSTGILIYASSFENNLQIIHKDKHFDQLNQKIRPLLV